MPTRSVTACLVVLALTGAAAAHPAAAATSEAVRVDVEVDPTAFVLSGYSLHVGASRGRLRAGLGAYAIALPAAFSGTRDFDVSFHGFGAKLQWFVLDARHPLFVGVDVSLLDVVVERDASDRARGQRAVAVGGHVGYRILLPGRFFVTPWIGVARAFGADDVTLDGATYEQRAVSIFPAVHLGYRFD